MTCKHNFIGTPHEPPCCEHCGISMMEYQRTRIAELEASLAASRQVAKTYIDLVDELEAQLEVERAVNAAQMRDRIELQAKLDKARNVLGEWRFAEDEFVNELWKAILDALGDEE